MANYPDFIESTGYGTGPGLCGWNCRHSFGPHLPGVSTNPYDSNPIDAEANRKTYELTQKQRAAERRIRREKTELLGYREALNRTSDGELKDALQQQYDAAARRLSKYNAKYNEFCKENDMKLYHDRLYVGGWGRSEASKAAAAGRRIG